MPLTASESPDFTLRPFLHRPIAVSFNIGTDNVSVWDAGVPGPDITWRSARASEARKSYDTASYAFLPERYADGHPNETRIMRNRSRRRAV